MPVCPCETETMSSSVTKNVLSYNTRLYEFKCILFSSNLIRNGSYTEGINTHISYIFDVMTGYVTNFILQAL